LPASAGKSALCRSKQLAIRALARETTRCTSSRPKVTARAFAALDDAFAGEAGTFSGSGGGASTATAGGSATGAAATAGGGSGAGGNSGAVPGEGTLTGEGAGAGSIRAVTTGAAERRHVVNAAPNNKRPTAAPSATNRVPRPRPRDAPSRVACAPPAPSTKVCADTTEMVTLLRGGGGGVAAAWAFRVASAGMRVFSAKRSSPNWPRRYSTSWACVASGTWSASPRSRASANSPAVA
ncbi:hypothetical protein STIAU_7029, partial [Stigmatella aurantiaca DW4/3-1]